MDAEYELGESSRPSSGSGVCSTAVQRLQWAVLTLLVLVAALLAVLTFQYARSDQASSTQQARINDLAAQLSIVTQRLSDLDGAVQVQAHSSSSLSFAVEQLRSASVCTLICEHGGEPSLDCSHCDACDAGWTGLHCHIPTVCTTRCSSPGASCLCLNGGLLNEATCECECAPGFTGSQCYDSASSSADVQVTFLSQLLGGNASDPDSDEDDEDFLSMNYLRRDSAAGQHIPSSVGYGRRPVTGRITQPILSLDVNGGQKFVDPTGAAYTVWSDVSLEVISQSSMLPPSKHEVFASVSDWTARLFDWQSSSTLVPSPLAMQHSSASKVFTAFFVAGSSLGVTSVQVPLYSTTLRQNIASYSLTQPVQKAIDYLMGFDYPERADLYFTFFDHVGTTIVTRSLAGGGIEKQTRIKGSVWNDPTIGAKVRDNSWVKEQLEISWSDKTGSGSSTKQDVRFTNNVDYQRQICRGGMSVESDCGAITDVQLWRSKLWALPVPVIDTVSPITQVVKNAKLAATMQRALADYIRAQQDHYSKN